MGYLHATAARHHIRVTGHSVTESVSRLPQRQLRAFVGLQRVDVYNALDANDPSGLAHLGTHRGPLAGGVGRLFFHAANLGVGLIWRPFGRPRRSLLAPSRHPGRKHGHQCIDDSGIAPWLGTSLARLRDGCDYRDRLGLELPVSPRLGARLIGFVRTDQCHCPGHDRTQCQPYGGTGLSRRFD